MDSPRNDAGEALLRAWLSLTAAVCNRRMVCGMTFNEAVVCNHLLYQQTHDPDHLLSATSLCEKTSLLKSQMNQILSSLEGRGYITRSRSARDRRQVDLRLTEAGRLAYQEAHRQASDLAAGLVERIGTETADGLTAQFERITADIRELRSEQKGTL